jgi:hypothetical protein
MKAKNIHFYTLFLWAISGKSEFESQEHWIVKVDYTMSLHNM